MWNSFEICIISFTVSSPVSFFFNIHNVRYTYVKCKHFYCDKIQLPRKVPSLSYTHTHIYIKSLFYRYVRMLQSFLCSAIFTYYSELFQIIHTWNKIMNRNVACKEISFLLILNSCNFPAIENCKTRSLEYSYFINIYCLGSWIFMFLKYHFALALPMRIFILLHSVI